ncbi:MAG: hypothetical protein ACRENN_10490, partial [Candidatus Eiseniibacteriota bacterium]
MITPTPTSPATSASIGGSIAHGRGRAPFLTLSDVDQAVAELEWCLERSARDVSIRNGPAFTPD